MLQMDIFNFHRVEYIVVDTGMAVFDREGIAKLASYRQGVGADRVLLVDDFLANGKALMGLIDLVHQAGATLVGASCAVEKGVQGGGDALRAQGIRVESLAVIESMSDTDITFRP